jgi:ent-kaurene synthase
LVLRNESEVPWPCRQVFWNICKVVHQFYVHVDGYASAKQMMHAGNAVVHHPLQIPRSPAHI